MTDLMLPAVATILDQRDETPDVRSYTLRYREPEAQQHFRFRPGQFMELSVFGVGEAPFCLASSPTRTNSFQLTVRRCGRVTDALHTLQPGDEVGLRGPCGNGFDVDTARGRDLLFVAGGIGLPPLRGLIWNVLDRRDEFGAVTILYGARTPSDLVYKDELQDWAARDDVTFRVTVDRAARGWDGHVGMVPVLFDDVNLHAGGSLAFVCGPPIMIRFVVQDLLMRGFPEERVISTLERMMQCGVGKCNHCCVGHRYLCRDGPVFSYRKIKEMWE
ncbi:MAG TPA: FAD/NAD(P)-binding protein [Longimicrobiales bacterium]|nr:FAD/NAD(P)-binding protein [Longimicrobiales bacterium]